MLGRMFRYINDSLDNFFKKPRNFLERNKIYFFYFFASIILAYLICLAFNIRIVSLEDFFFISYKDIDNTFLTLLKGGFFFIAWVLSFIKTYFLVFILNIPFFLFDDFFSFNIYMFLSQFSYFLEKEAFDELKTFNVVTWVQYLVYWNEFKIKYFSSNQFLKLIFLNSNLPIFFYFGILFILSTIFSLFLLSYLGLYGVFILNLITIIAFWISSIFYFNSFYLDNAFYKINLGKWFIIAFSHIVYFDVFIDCVSYSFMFLTLTIAVFVYIYTFSYFRYEPNVERLLLLINCFVISMICLVTSGNLFVLFLGWEMIGLTSFFLINFWSTRISTLKAAFKAFVFNKFSDVSLLIAIFIIFFCINDINIVSFNSQISYYNNFYLNISNNEIPLIEIISFFLITCSFIKSAQFGFHIWLPDSMEAPVPASALIHSATLVSAGVFVLLRFTSLFEYSLYSYYITPIVGSFTAFFGGLCSSYQSDIKKILAYSTISHCGFLMVCYSTYIPEFTILYLYIHGFFKAAVFLCVGNIIRFSRNYQDFRKMGGFWKYLPFECFSSFICLINLCGLPFSIGYYIKHLLLIGVYMNNYFLIFIFLNILGGAIFGLVYSYRLFYYVFFDFKKAKKIIYLQSNRNNFKSSFYTNTTLASNISISLLIITAYIVSLYMLSIFLNKSSLGDGLDVYSIHSSQYEEFNHPLLSSINNIGYFNWLVLIVIISIFLYSWRTVNNYHDVINFFSFSITFFIFFYLFYTILTI